MRLDDPLVTKHIENVRITSDNSGVVYMAAPASGGQTELYQARFSAPGVGTKLNGSLPAGVHVQSYALVPDGAGAVFLATEQVFSDPPGKIMVDTELHRTNFAAPGASTVLINPAIAGGEIEEFMVTSDSTGVVYRADQALDKLIELHRVIFSSPGQSNTLSGPLVTGGNVRGFFAHGGTISSPVSR